MCHHAVAHVQLCLRSMCARDTLHLHRAPATVDGLVAVATAGVGQAFVHGRADTERELVLKTENEKQHGGTGTRVGGSGPRELGRGPGVGARGAVTTNAHFRS